MTKRKLKPCPFCGSLDLEDMISSWGGETSIVCSNCGAAGPMVEKSPVRAWNKRWREVVDGDA